MSKDKGDPSKLHDFFNSNFNSSRYSETGQNVSIGPAHDWGDPTKPPPPKGSPKRTVPVFDGSDAYANLRKMAVSLQHTPTGRSLYFKAFITNFNESYDPQWDSAALYGRPDPIWMYKSTGRTLSLQYTIPAFSEHEAYENLGKVQTLIQFLYPSYNTAKNPVEKEPDFFAGDISQAPLLRLKVMNIAQKGDLGEWRTAGYTRQGAPSPSPNAQEKAGYELYDEYRSNPASSQGLLGVLTNLTIDHHLHDVGGFLPFNTSNTILPKQIDISFDYSIIHEHEVGWDGANFGTAGGLELFPYGVTLDNPFEQQFWAEKIAKQEEEAKTQEQKRKEEEERKRIAAKVQAQLEQEEADYLRAKELGGVDMLSQQSVTYGARSGPGRSQFERAQAWAQGLKGFERTVYDESGMGTQGMIDLDRYRDTQYDE